MTEPGADRVECYSGHTYAQEPRAVVWQGRRYPVTTVEQRWRTPEGPAFVVETEPGLRFELHYRELEDAWTIQPLSDLNSREQERENHNPGTTRPDHYKDKEVRERT